MMKLNYIIFIISSLSFLQGAFTANSEGLVVHTQQGDVAGTMVTPTVRQFLGIPYATAQRWEAPSAPPIRTSILQATKFGDSCVQLLSPPNVEFLKLAGVGNDIDVPESENCLSVNIWTPSVRRKQKTAVMLWVYGGSFEFGTSNVKFYNGQNIVENNDDVTVVSFNYRINIFGQPNAPQLVSTKKSQNFGLLDLDAAVQWVHNNIAAFGGDPNRITLFGQSAGSGAIDAYTFAHPDDHRVKGVIEQSGALAGLFNSSSTSDPTPLNATAWNTVGTAVGCGANVTDAQFACMQKVPFGTLENAVLSTGAGFNPFIDDITLFSDVPARAQSGNFLRVPLLSGSTAQEGDIFVVAAELLANGTVIPGVTEMIADALTLTTFTCPAGVAALQRRNVGVPAWRYQYQGIFPDISTPPELRAFHASEIPIVFGTYNDTTLNVPATPNEIALSKFMQKAWVTFARNPQSGLVGLGWPMYNPNTASLAQFGNASNQSSIVLTSGALTDLLCPH